MSKEEEKTQEEFAIMERADETQIIQELQGHYLEEFVYSFEVGSRRVVGLSWAGIKECSYRLGGIEVESCQIEDKGDGWTVLCKASDKFKGSSRFGVSTQSKTMKLKDGSAVADEFSLQKCVSKAQRNAIRRLIPELFIKNFVDRYLAEHGKAPKAVAPAVAPAVTQPVYLAPEEVGESLANANLNVSMVEIEVSESGMTVRPAKYLDTLTWTQFNGSLRQLGFFWISAGKDSRWERK